MTQVYHVEMEYMLTIFITMVGTLLVWILHRLDKVIETIERYHWKTQEDLGFLMSLYQRPPKEDSKSSHS